MRLPWKPLFTTISYNYAKNRHFAFHSETETRNQQQKRQGLPNINNKVCYILSVMHSLAVSLPAEKLQNNSELCNLIKDTKKCIEGHKTADEAQEIMESIWDYTKCKYPEYQILNEMRQEDASEYLRRLMESEELLRGESEIYIKVTSKCLNNKCESLKSEQRKIMLMILKTRKVTY